MPIYQLVYQSLALHPWDDEALRGLAAQSRDRNQAQAITGILFYANRHFLQVLEGEQSAVEQLYERIGRDPRHTDEVVIRRGAAPQRLFPEWSMGLGTVGAAALARLADHFGRGSWAEQWPPVSPVVPGAIHQAPNGSRATLSQGPPR